MFIFVMNTGKTLTFWKFSFNLSKLMFIKLLAIKNQSSKPKEGLNGPSRTDVMNERVISDLMAGGFHRNG